MKRRVIYPATRAVEHAVTQPGVRPLRLFAVLWPLWQVETSAQVYDGQDFELIDHFVLRALHEADIHDRPGLARLLGLPPGIVERCVAFLIAIQLVADDGGRLRVRELGRRSLRDGLRYVPSTSRLKVLFERQTGRPLPRPYYDSAVTVLDVAKVADEQLGDRTRFRSLFTAAPYDPQVLPRLAERTDRAEFNLPTQLRELRQENVREGYLPCYLIETTDGQLLAYSNVAEHRDSFLEQVCADSAVEHLIEAEDTGDPATIWRTWLGRSTAYKGGRLDRAGGRWRVVMAAGTFGEPPRLPPSRVGAYQFWDNHFIQVWCGDVAVRRAALLDRALGVATVPAVTTLADFQTRVRYLAEVLEVPEVSVADLRRHAGHTGDTRRLQSLDALERGTA
ncbi:hypothetical protein [Dactylosporangium sp. NPDC051541]|uniref:hypothetical protein n=1 Tax=Dactylosporangium sp. NPDC051541 TaxID=3363977 RepID=UPI003791D158